MNGLAALLITGFLLVPLAWTQQPQTDSPPAEEDGETRSGVYLEEIVVTAEKREASVQDTAAAINAFDDAALQREGIETISDIQLSVPNMTFSAYNFGTPHLSIRGISRGVVSVTGDDATSIHLNGAYVQNAAAQSPPILLLEFFDLERVEILRGPQGTLYGRNSTGGVVNFITRKPDLEKGGGLISLETGSDGLARSIIVANIPVGERFGIRIGGYSSELDGFVKNTLTQNTIDSRAIDAARVSLRWRGDKVETNLVLEHFSESDTRMRTSKQACKTDTRPAPFSIGCEAGHDLETFDAVNSSATLASIWANQYGLYGTAAFSGVAGGTFNGFVTCRREGDNPRAGQKAGNLNADQDCSYVPNPNLREVAAPTDPTWFSRYQAATMTVDIKAREDLTLTFSGHHGYQKNRSVTDYNWNTGAAPFLSSVQLGNEMTENTNQIGRLNKEASDLNAGLDALARTPGLLIPCQSGRSGCDAADYSTRTRADLAAFYSTASSAQKSSIDTAIAAVPEFSDADLSNYSGVTGAAAAAAGGAAGLGAINNALYLTSLNLDAKGVLFPDGNVGPDPRVAGHSVPIGNDLSYSDGEINSFEMRLVSDFQDSPWDFISGLFAMQANTDGDYQVHANGLANFATLAYQDDLEDANKTPQRAGSRDYTVVPAQRGCQNGVCSPRNLIQQGGFTIADLSYYNNQTIYEVRSWALFGEVYRNLWEDTRLTVGLRYTQEEKRVVAATQSLIAVTTPPQRNRVQNWEEATGRINIDHRFGQDAMIYGTLANSYKSGGFNPQSATGAFADLFAPEYINSLEVGVKSTTAEGRLQTNVAYFWYDYEGYQTSKIIDRTSVNENIDVRIQGVEAELVAYPTPSLRMDLNVAWLETAIQDSFSVNTADPTNGMPGWVTVKGLQAATWIAPTTDLNGDGEVDGDDATHACANPTGGLACTVAPGRPTNAAVSNVPIVKNVGDVDTDGYEQGVTYTEGFHASGLSLPFGFEVDLDGNQMAEAPEASVKFGLQYTVDLGGSTNFVMRGDYYWQSEFYGRIFNSDQNLIPEWDVINLSFSVEAKEGNWSLKGWVDNLNDDDHITGLYFTDASSGNFTNIFLLNPRTYGVSWDYRF